MVKLQNIIRDVETSKKLKMIFRKNHPLKTRQIKFHNVLIFFLRAGSLCEGRQCSVARLCASEVAPRERNQKVRSHSGAVTAAH